MTAEFTEADLQRPHRDALMAESTTSQPADSHSRLTAIEGYLALACVGLMLVGTASRVELPAPLGLVFGSLVWGLAWLFAISGVRRGRGWAKAAAWVSLAFLVWHAGMLLLLAFH